MVTDSTSYLDPKLVAAFAIERVSLSVVHGDDAHEELTIDDLDGFYRRLHDLKDLPTTSQPSIGQFLDVYRPILDAGDDIVSVHLSGAISGTVDSAAQAREQLARDGLDPRRIVVIDSRSACGGLGLQALAAATAARRGAGVDDAAAAVLAMRERMSFWFVVDTLEYLRRGGRIGAAQALIGGAIKIKPILTIGEEGIVPVDKVRTQGRALDRLMSMAREAAEPGAAGPDAAFAVQHIQDPELVAKVAHRCRDEFGCEPLFTNEIGPVIGAHVGPGLIGMAIYPSELIDRP